MYPDTLDYNVLEPELSKHIFECITGKDSSLVLKKREGKISHAQMANWGADVVQTAKALMQHALANSKVAADKRGRAAVVVACTFLRRVILEKNKDMFTADRLRVVEVYLHEHLNGSADTAFDPEVAVQRAQRSLTTQTPLEEANALRVQFDAPITANTLENRIAVLHDRFLSSQYFIDTHSNEYAWVRSEHVTEIKNRIWGTVGLSNSELAALDRCVQWVADSESGTPHAKVLPKHVFRLGDRMMSNEVTALLTGTARRGALSDDLRRDLLVARELFARQDF